MIMNNQSKRAGFTLVELMIAMSLFSFILLFAVNAFIQINKIYVKGITTKRMNNQADAIVGDITRSFMQEKGISLYCDSNLCNNDTISTPAGSSSAYKICFNNSDTVYEWQANTAGKFKRYLSKKCSADDVRLPVNLIDNKTIVRALDVTPVASVDDMRAYKVDLVLSTQRADQLEGDGVNTKCKSQISDQFCAVTSRSTIIRVLE